MAAVVLNSVVECRERRVWGEEGAEAGWIVCVNKLHMSEGSQMLLVDD